MSGKRFEDYVLPGESGFHVRGKLYLNFIEYVEKKRRPLQIYLDALGDGALKDYLSQPFDPRNWYDAFPIVPLTEVAAQIEGMTFGDYMRMRARMQVTEDLNGILKLFLKIASPSLVAARLPRLAGHYLDFGVHAQEPVGPRAIHVRRTGMPLRLAPWFSLASGTFIELALEAAGASRVRVHVHPFVTEPRARGFNMVSIDLDFSWS